MLRQFAGAATNGPSMQLYNDGIDQGASVTAKYIGWGSLERPLTPAFDGTWVIAAFSQNTHRPHKHQRMKAWKGAAC
jgi:hypothetical protein